MEAVRQGLAERGRDARVVTLSGLGPDADVASIGPGTHVDDVESVLDADDLREVVLVGHAYSGIVAGQVADRSPQRVAHTVYRVKGAPGWTFITLDPGHWPMITRTEELAELLNAQSCITLPRSARAGGRPGRRRRRGRRGAR